MNRRESRHSTPAEIFPGVAPPQSVTALKPNRTALEVSDSAAESSTGGGRGEALTLGVTEDENEIVALAEG